jgi:hypothetical protein
MRPILQPGNRGARRLARAARRASRHYTVEGCELRAAEFMVAAHAAYGDDAPRGALPPAAGARSARGRARHAAAILDHLAERAITAALVARFELQMLAELGFGLDLDNVRATGATASCLCVAEVGRAVSRVARRAVARPHAAPAAFPRARMGRGTSRTPEAERSPSRSPASSSSATCSSRAAFRCTTRARASSTPCCVRTRGLRR